MIKKNLENRNWIKKFLENKNGFKYFAQEKFLKWNYQNKNDNMKNMIYLCMLRIVLNSLEILFGVRKFFEYFNSGSFIIEKELIINKMMKMNKKQLILITMKMKIIL
jgi:hypothetical protein